MQQRVEPYVGASSSWRASLPDVDSLSSASYLDANGTERHLQPGEPPVDDHVTLELQLHSTEHTIDIPINDLPQEPRPVQQDVATALRIAINDVFAVDDIVNELVDDVTELDVTVGTILLNRYVLHRLIGTGGTCRVFLAEDLHRRLSPDASGELIGAPIEAGVRSLPDSAQQLIMTLTHHSLRVGLAAIVATMDREPGKAAAPGQTDPHRHPGQSRARCLAGRSRGRPVGSRCYALDPRPRLRCHGRLVPHPRQG